MAKFSLNLNKCKVMLFFRTRKKILIHNEHLSRVESVKDLGFRLVSSLFSSNCAEFITCKALHILGFICQSVSNFNQIK